jgi:hypothetical protein
MALVETAPDGKQSAFVAKRDEKVDALWVKEEMSGDIVTEDQMWANYEYFMRAVLPTAKEAGVKNYEVTSWNGVFAPKGTPKEVIDTMNKAMHEVLAQPDVVAQFAKLGVEAHASSPDELMMRLKDDIKKWTAVIEKAGIAKK